MPLRPSPMESAKTGWMKRTPEPSGGGGTTIVPSRSSWGRAPVIVTRCTNTAASATARTPATRPGRLSTTSVAAALNLAPAERFPIDALTTTNNKQRENFMKNQKKTGLWALLPFTLLIGSFAAAQVTVSDPNEELVQGIDEKLTSFEFDSSGITTPPATELPASRLSIKAFDDANIVSRLIQTKEPFRKGATIGSRRESIS